MASKSCGARNFTRFARYSKQDLNTSIGECVLSNLISDDALFKRAFAASKGRLTEEVSTRVRVPRRTPAEAADQALVLDL
ncbi:MAG: hypothetical protein AAF194_02135, partial [Pseudomonadota bacterium]